MAVNIFTTYIFAFSSLPYCDLHNVFLTLLTRHLLIGSKHTLPFIRKDFNGLKGNTKKMFHTLIDLQPGANVNNIAFYML